MSELPGGGGSHPAAGLPDVEGLADTDGPSDAERGGGPGERTSLSWQRSELSVALVGALVTAAALRLDVTWVAATAGAVALAGVVLAIAGRPREVHLGREDVAPWPWLPRIAVATAAVALLGAALGVTELLRALR